MHRLPLLVAAATVLAVGPGAASIVDPGGPGTGQVSTPATVTDPATGVDVAFADTGNPGGGLRISPALAGPVGGAGISAGSVELAGIVGQRGSASAFGLGDPVGELSFEAPGNGLHSDLDVLGTHGGTKAAGPDIPLLAVDLLDLEGVVAGLSAFGGVLSATIDTGAPVRTARYVGGLDFTVASEENRGGNHGGGVAPFPASLPLLAAGILGLAALFAAAAGLARLTEAPTAELLWWSGRAARVFSRYRPGAGGEILHRSEISASAGGQGIFRISTRSSGLPRSGHSRPRRRRRRRRRWRR